MNENSPLLFPIKRLLYSRKFLVAVLGVLAVVFQEFLSPEVADTLVKLAMALIGAIAAEDAAASLGNRGPQG